jgi:large subunit GTPase 1
MFPLQGPSQLVRHANLFSTHSLVRQAWADYFDAQNIQYAFFSAFNATAAQEQADKQRRRQMGEEEEIKFAEDQYAAEHMDSDTDSEEEEEDEEEGKNDVAQVDDEDDEDFEDEDDIEDEDDENPEVQSALAESMLKGQDGETAETQALRKEMEQKLSVDTPEYDQLAENHAMKGMFDDEVDHDPRTRVLTVLELEELFERVAPSLSEFATEHNPTPDKLTVGLVGYPNVGKSSTINALLGSKKVSVSATPGKTKHFQTLPFSNKVTLCDCPGLVFPQFVHTEADMVCDGVLPIDQMREYSAPIELICRRVPREVLEGTYAIRIEVKDIEDGGTGLVHWEDFLSGYASKFWPMLYWKR